MTPPPEVLIVDDDSGVLQVLGVVLRQHGFVAHLARGGAEAVEVYERHRESIGVVLMDVQMPDMDGPQTLAALRGLDPAVRCCFMSGETGRYSSGDLLALGVSHFFEKPFRNFDQLAEALRQVAEKA
jgi:CheY-like chemotaxis protein